jgi:hypothetical protein
MLGQTRKRIGARQARLAAEAWLELTRPSGCVGGNGREERYLIVAFTVITDVPEAVGP